MNIELNKKLNVINKRIIYNFLFNLEKILNLIVKFFMENPGFDSNLVSLLFENIKNLQKFFKENNKDIYINKFAHTQNHWLYFFDKIGCNDQFYNLTMCEETMKLYWNEKFKDTIYNENNLGEINYEIKYASLVEDTLFKGEDYVENEGQ